MLRLILPALAIALAACGDDGGERPVVSAPTVPVPGGNDGTDDTGAQQPTGPVGAPGGSDDPSILELVNATISALSVSTTAGEKLEELAKVRLEGDMTLLHMANDPSVVKALIAVGADPNARHETGATPLHSGATLDNPDPSIIAALIAGGVDPNARIKIGSTPLHVAAGYNSNPAVVETLIAGGADPNARDESDFTPLHMVVLENPAVVEALIAGGADPKARDNAGRPPSTMRKTTKRCGEPTSTGD